MFQWLRDRLFGKPAPALKPVPIPPRAAPPRPASAPPRTAAPVMPRVSLPLTVSQCTHLGESTDGGTTYACHHANHGLTTLAECGACPDLAPRIHPFTGPVVRNLMYHIWPAKHTDQWRWNLDQLLQRIHVFNGRRIVTIATDHKSESAEKVKAHLGNAVTDYMERDNNPRLGEQPSFVPMLASIIPYSGNNDITFYGHAKGVKYAGGIELDIIRTWTGLMYGTCLDYVPLVERHLQRWAITGSFRKTNIKLGGSRWHYCGTYYWFRNSIISAYDWWGIDEDWSGTESWPGRLIRNPMRTSTLFVEGAKYSHTGASIAVRSDEYQRRVILPDFERWKATNAKNRNTA